MKVKRIKELLLVPFILIYFVLFVFNLVYDINLFILYFCGSYS